MSYCRTGGGISGGALATDALRIYKSLDPQGRLAFFEPLIRDFSYSPDEVGHAADAYRQEPSVENLRQLQQVVEPPRQELFRRLNIAPGGTRTLIEMRSRVLNELDSHPHLEPSPRISVTCWPPGSIADS